MSNNPLEHAEHIAHAGHGDGEHGHGGGHDEHAVHNKLGTYIGITMAVLGVILAYCAAKVGAERTELIQTLVEQQNAHAKYQAQDMKHRIGVISLRQIHGEIPAAEIRRHLDAELASIDAEGAAPPAAAGTVAPAVAVSPAAPPKPVAATKPEAAAAAAEGVAVTRAARAVGHNLLEGMTPSKPEAAALAQTVERYEKEAHAAEEWVESFEPAIQAHVLGQERFELAQLLAEIGIVVASVGLLIKKSAPWFLALALGLGAVGLVAHTHLSAGGVAHDAEVKIEERGKEYREMRTADKTTESDRALVAEVLAWSGASAPAKPAPAHHEPAKEGHGH
jgi:hypothetical protein